jgi:NADPH-dependent glutamate synthase beta subunit-like oxidoreductase
MLPAMKVPEHPTPVVGICGAAVAGSESARLFTEGGALAVVLEQHDRPYGKIEDGLPRWHEKLRHKEFARIDENLSQPGVLFVPRTRIGRDVSFAHLTDELGLSAVILATGAWRDRPLPVAGIDRFVDRGLVYQNALVHWFNHFEEADYAGPSLELPDGAIVVGGGLASIDVVKILNLEAYRRALAARGVEIDAVALEQVGIDATLAAHELTPADLGVRGCTLFDRRRMSDMPLATAADPTPAQLEKLRAARVRIMEKVMRKYLVRFEERAVPVAPIVEDDRLAGLVFRRTEVVGDRLEERAGSDFEVRAPLTVSSIGSVPEPIAGVPMRGDLFEFDSTATGALHGVDRVWGLGNVLTGKGNIRDSRVNASVVAEQIIENLLGVHESGHGPEELSRALHEEFRARAQQFVDHALDGVELPPERVARILDWVQARWAEVGYGGDYRTWIEAHRPR